MSSWTLDQTSIHLDNANVFLDGYVGTNPNPPPPQTATPLVIVGGAVGAGILIELNGSLLVL